MSEKMVWLAMFLYAVCAVILCVAIYGTIFANLVGAGELYSDPSAPERKLWCDTGQCRWLTPQAVTEAGPQKPVLPSADAPSLVSDFPCAQVVDNRGLTLEPAPVAPELASTPLCVVGGTTTLAAAGGMPLRGVVGIWAHADPYLAHGPKVVGTRIGVATVPGSSFFIREALFEDIQGPCIENTAGRPGHVMHSFFDGCRTFYQGGTGLTTQTGDFVAIEDSLIRMPEGATAPFDDESGPPLSLKRVTFLIEGSPTAGKPGLPDLKECQDVTVVYDGPTELAGSWPSDCVTVTRDRTVWDQAVAAWREAYSTK